MVDLAFNTVDEERIADDSKSFDPRASESTETRTHCPYCALQCGMILSNSGFRLGVSGDYLFPVNRGALCVKGATAAEVVSHPDRLLTPLARNPRGILVRVDWDEALDRIADAFKEAKTRHGADSAGVFGGGSLTNEKAYLLGKFARVALGTPNIDYNGRFCMSSAAAASIKTFGLDRGLPFPLADIASAEVILLVGSNIAETMPPLMRYFDEQRANKGRLIVVDPRSSITAQRATLHLRLTPGSDAAVANGILHVLIREGMIDSGYIENRTEGFERVKSTVITYWPERVERISGVPEATLIQAARMLGTAKAAMVLTGRGPEQQSQGVNNALAYINIALALGKVGRPSSGYGCLTGQGNGQGGREHGQKADQLPGYRKIDDPAARRHIASVWGIPESEIPGPGMSAYEMLDSAGRDGGVRALMIIGSNVAVSAPNSLHVEERLQSLDFLAVSDFFRSETAEHADVVLPAAQWAEEEGTITNLEGRVIRRRRAIHPSPSVRTDLQTLCTLAERMDKGAFFRFNTVCEVFEELRLASKGGPADYSGISYEKIDLNDGVFWPCPSDSHTGTPRLFTDHFPTETGRARFHAVRHLPPAEEPSEEYPLFLTTGRVLAQYQSGTQTRRVAELDDLTPEPLAEMHPATAKRYRLTDSTLVTLRSRRGAATFRLKVTNTIREETVFVPFHWAGEQSVNRLTNPALDPVSKMPEFKVCAVRIDRD